MAVNVDKCHDYNELTLIYTAEAAQDSGILLAIGGSDHGEGGN
jgi:hypothetical protein